MNEHLDDDDPVLSRGERELTLSTGSILGIFFGLVLLCGVCFGVGYNMGRKSLPTPLALSDIPSDTAGSDASGAAKPSAGSPLNDMPAAQPAPAAPAPVEKLEKPKPAPIVRKPPPVDADADTATASTPAPSHTTESTTTPPVRTVSPSALMPGTGSASSGTGSIMVQVAAVSHPEDAELLVGALRSRGYAVTARPGASDGFIHVQVGPFSSKPAAEAMRQRLLADGYNAILK